MEAQILRIDLLRAKLAYIVLRIHLRAPAFHAWDFEHGAFRNFDLQVVLNAIFALLVPAG